MADEIECSKNIRPDLEQRLGQLTYQIGKELEKRKVIDQKLQRLQQESNEVATEIEKLEQRTDS